jgi:hypothetical protein
MRLIEPQSQSGRGAEEKKIPCPCRESKPGRPVRGLVTILTELPGSHFLYDKPFKVGKERLFLNSTENSTRHEIKGKKYDTKLLV